MKVLVTGGAGFIGSHLAHALLGQGFQVTVLDDLSTGLTANLPADVTLIEGDVCDRNLLARIMPGISTVFHLAAVASVQDSLDRPLDVHRANLTGTLVLLESAAAHGVRRFVFSSSAAVYGDAGGRPAREDMRPQPLSNYGVQKLASEQYCSVYHRLHGIETVCLRYFNIFGSRQRTNSPYSGVIAKFMDAAKRGEAPVIFGDGGQTRDFCHVRDVVRANIQAATIESPGIAGGVFNIGSGHAISVLQMVGEIRKIFPCSPAPRHEAARVGEIRASRADIEMARRCLNFEPKIGFADGLSEWVSMAGS